MPSEALAQEGTREQSDKASHGTGNLRAGRRRRASRETGPSAYPIPNPAIASRAVSLNDFNHSVPSPPA